MSVHHLIANRVVNDTRYILPCFGVGCTVSKILLKFLSSSWRMASSCAKLADVAVQGVSTRSLKFVSHSHFAEHVSPDCLIAVSLVLCDT